MRPALHPAQAWREFRSRIPDDLRRNEPKLPREPERTLLLPAAFEYWLDETTTQEIRRWVKSRGESGVFYFLTEKARDDTKLDFRLPVDSLTPAALKDRNPGVGVEVVLAGENLDWAISIDHEGRTFVWGPRDLRDKLLRLSEGSPLVQP